MRPLVVFASMTKNPEKLKNASEKLTKFLEIIEKLRDPEKGCPWDKEQTFESLRPLLLEEVYEVLDAVYLEPKKVAEELGDVLSIMALYCEIASEKKFFEFADVLEGISSKLIRRHPHIFSNTVVNSTEQVAKNWESIKQEEKREKNARPSALDGVPRSMPALLRAHRIGEKCARLGFEWRTVEDVKDKVLEEVQEFVETLESSKATKAEQADEFGDIFFALCQLARRYNFNPEELLSGAVNKFTGRFQKIEQLAYERGNPKGIEGMTLEQMDALWDEVKGLEKAQ